MSIVGSVPELDCEPLFCNCMSSGFDNNGDRHLSEPDVGELCLILEADDCACCVPNNGDAEPSEPEGGGEYTTLNTDDCACCVLENGDGDLSESEDDGVYLILNAEDCSFCVPKNEDEDLSESEDDVFCLFPDAVDGACDWVQFGDGVSIKMWQSSFLCNVKYKIHVALGFVVCSRS